MIFTTAQVYVIGILTGIIGSWLIDAVLLEIIKRRQSND